MEPGRTSFTDFLFTAFDKGDYSTDDVIAFVLPLFREVLHFHELGLVAPFEKDDALFITEGKPLFDGTLAHAPTFALSRVKALFKKASDGQSPAYLPGYRSFEHLLGHHDPQTDIFSLGLILGSMAMVACFFGNRFLAWYWRLF